MAQGVLFRDASGELHVAYLRDGPRNEIIVSAGALGSPQLLMLSGIGPEAHLRAHNIDVVLDQPSVGQDMSDNPMNAVFVPSPVPVEVSLIQVVGITHSGSYIEAAGGENFSRREPRNYGMFSPKVSITVSSVSFCCFRKVYGMQYNHFQATLLSPQMHLLFCNLFCMYLGIHCRIISHINKYVRGVLSRFTQTLFPNMHFLYNNFNTFNQLLDECFL